MGRVGREISAGGRKVACWSRNENQAHALLTHILRTPPANVLADVHKEVSTDLCCGSNGDKMNTTHQFMGQCTIHAINV